MNKLYLIIINYFKIILIFNNLIFNWFFNVKFLFLKTTLTRRILLFVLRTFSIIIRKKKKIIYYLNIKIYSKLIYFVLYLKQLFIPFTSCKKRSISDFAFPIKRYNKMKIIQLNVMEEYIQLALIRYVP